MMHIGCSCTQRHATTVVAKAVHKIQVGDVILTATATEIADFTGSEAEVDTMLLRDARTVGEVRDLSPRFAFRNAATGTFIANVGRREQLLVAVCR